MVDVDRVGLVYYLVLYGNNYFFLNWKTIIWDIITLFFRCFVYAKTFKFYFRCESLFNAVFGIFTNFLMGGGISELIGVCVGEIRGKLLT